MIDYAPISVEGVLKQLGLSHSKTGQNHVRLVCPFHRGGNKDGTLYVCAKGSNKGLWYCFSCHGRGDLAAFVMQRQSLTYPEALAFLGVSSSVPPVSPRARALFAGLQDGIRAMEQILSPTLPHSPLLPPLPRTADAGGVVWEYLQSRGFGPDEKWVMRWAGLRHGLDGPYHDRLLFPVGQGEEPLWYAGRAMNGQTPKMFYPKGARVQEYLLGAAKLPEMHRWRETLAVVEGPMDYLRLVSLSIPAVALFGTNMSEFQAVKIMESGFAHVELALDGDEAGRRAIPKAARKLLSAFPTVQAVLLPQDADPGMMTRSEEFYVLPRVEALMVKGE